MDAVNGDLGKPYANVHMDNEHIDSYYSRSLGAEPPHPELDQEVKTPVCVIGGGMAGSALTLGLVERGVKNPVLIEANRIGWGASGRNGGFISAGYSLPPFDIVKKVGERHAQELYGLTQSAMTLIRKRMEGVADDLLDPNMGILNVSWFNEPEKVRLYAERMNAVFGEKFEFWPREKVREYYTTDRYYDAHFKTGGLIANVLKYTGHVAKLASNLGAGVYEKSPVTKVKKVNDQWHVKTRKGTVIADQVVYCCSAYIGNLKMKLANATLPVATYVLLTEPLGDRMQTAIRALHGASDNRTSSNYYRPLPDGRLLWGGRVSMFHPSQEALKVVMMKDLLHVYPQLKGIKAEVAWGGHMGYTKHKMPQIGRLKDGSWHCQGFCGHGMCSTVAGAEVTAAAIANGDETYKLFEPFGLDYAAKPFGPVVAQTVYWFYQIGDKIKERRVNQCQPSTTGIV
jgi:gamma-glutamylputrescine oxidase